MRLDDVTRSYDKASKYYDLLTDVVFGRVLGVEKVRARAVELLGDLRGATVLDVGCGTGRNLPLLEARVGERGRIVGFDYPEGMLAQARRRVREHGWFNVELVRGDAAELVGVPDSVDALPSVWCLGIVHDLPAALERALCVLRPGGALAIMDFSRARPDRGLLRWLYPLYSVALERAGIDAAEDLDDGRLREKWARGRELLRSRLADVREETYMKDAGFILAGHKPAA